jgi:predicted neuraminidase
MLQFKINPMDLLQRSAIYLVQKPITQNAKTQHSSVISQEFVYESAPYPSCHASTLAQLTDGRIAAAWFGGTRERDPDVCIYFSIRDGTQWATPIQVADGMQTTGPRLPTWNPVLFQAPEGGPLFLFYKVGPHPSQWWGMVKRSIDGGLTWSEEDRLPDGLIGPVKNKPVVLADGSWLSPSSTEGNETGWLLHFERSQDRGVTWEKIGPVSKGAGLDAIQPSVLFHKDGLLQAVCRTKQGTVGMTWSSDGGVTWSGLSATDLPNPNSGTDAITLADGRHFMVYNHFAHSPPPQRPGKGVRYPLDVAVSLDGVTWKRVLTLESEPCDAGYAYPAVIQSRDGRVHLSYTWDRKRIKYVVIDPQSL